MGLDCWNVNLSSNNDAIQIHNLKLDYTERRIIQLQNDLKELFYNNKEMKNLSVKMNLKAGAQIIQRKRQIPIHLQDQVAKELKRPINHGYVDRATETTEDGIVSPAVITVKKDKAVKIALDSAKLNEDTVKRKTRMPNMEELKSRTSRQISEGTDREILATKLDFDHA